MSDPNHRKRQREPDNTPEKNVDTNITTPDSSGKTNPMVFSSLFSPDKIWGAGTEKGNNVVPVWFQYPYNSVYPGL